MLCIEFNWGMEVIAHPPFAAFYGINCSLAFGSIQADQAIISLFLGKDCPEECASLDRFSKCFIEHIPPMGEVIPQGLDQLAVFQ